MVLDIITVQRRRILNCVDMTEKRRGIINSVIEWHTNKEVCLCVWKMIICVVELHASTVEKKVFFIVFLFWSLTQLCCISFDCFCYPALVLPLQTYRMTRIKCVCACVCASDWACVYVRVRGRETCCPPLMWTNAIGRQWNQLEFFPTINACSQCFDRCCCRDSWTFISSTVFACI